MSFYLLQLPLGRAGGSRKGRGVSSGGGWGRGVNWREGSEDRLVLPEDAAPEIAARWRQAAQLLPDVQVQGWELGV